MVHTFHKPLTGPQINNRAELSAVWVVMMTIRELTRHTFVLRLAIVRKLSKILSCTVNGIG